MFFRGHYNGSWHPGLFGWFHDLKEKCKEEEEERLKKAEEARDRRLRELQIAALEEREETTAAATAATAATTTYYDGTTWSEETYNAFTAWRKKTYDAEDMTPAQILVLMQAGADFEGLGQGQASIRERIMGELSQLLDRNETVEEVEVVEAVDAEDEFDSWEPMTEADRRGYLKSDECPLSQIVGNENAVKVLKWILFQALGDPNHVCRINLAFLGPSSAGKTTISRIFSEVLDTEHIEISPKAVKTAHDIFEQIPKVQLSDGTWLAKPCTVLLDEAHALQSNIEQALLKATERKDAMLVTEKGAVLNCENICWHFATTDVGRMFDAFVNRFHHINLRLYTKPEIAEIIKRNYPTWDITVCQVVARYCSRVPREALSFANMVQLACAAKGGGGIEALASETAEMQGVDPFGMTYRRLNILRALGQRPMSINQLCVVAGCKEEELRKFVLPWLMESTPDQEPYIIVTNRHYITSAGQAELDKREIAHGGEEVLPS